MTNEILAEVQISPDRTVWVITLSSSDDKPITVQNAVDAVVDYFDYRCELAYLTKDPIDDGSH